MYIRSSRGPTRVPLIAPTTPSRSLKRVTPPSRPGTVRVSRSVQRKTFYLTGKQQFPGGHADTIGRRPTMEDACVAAGEFAGPKTQFFAVYDGHGGKEAAHYCAEKLHEIIAQNYTRGESIQPIIKKAIHEVNQYVISRWEFAGTTAAIAVIVDSMIYTANVGDSRVILIQPNGKAKRMTFDHKATAPKERRLVIKRGGTIFQGRVNGILMLSRAIGDATVAKFISCDPYMSEAPLEEGMKMILACDGVWDVMSDQYAADIFTRSGNPIEAARAIKTEALKRGSTDNISVICVELKYKTENEDDNHSEIGNDEPKELVVRPPNSPRDNHLLTLRLNAFINSSPSKSNEKQLSTTGPLQQQQQQQQPNSKQVSSNEPLQKQSNEQFSSTTPLPRINNDTIQPHFNTIKLDDLTDDINEALQQLPDL